MIKILKIHQIGFLQLFCCLAVITGSYRASAYTWYGVWAAKRAEHNNNSERSPSERLRDDVKNLTLRPLNERFLNREINSEHPLGAEPTQAKELAAPRDDLSSTLPSIDTYSVPVLPEVGDYSTSVEIFSSTEKSSDGSARDNWLNNMARLYNQHPGRVGSVTIRRIDSGMAYQFLIQQMFNPEEAYTVDAYSPSNDLWIRMAESRGVQLTKISDSLVHNVAGIVISKAKLRSLENYSQTTVTDFIEAVSEGKLKMGYTNPYTSSTGLNFLSTVLQTLALKQKTNFSNSLVVNAFRKFQDGIPLIYESTLQMREAVKGGERLDAMVMEYQTFVNSGLSGDFSFIPFGELHNNPLYASGQLPPKKLAILKDFVQFIENNKEAQSSAKAMGFSRLLDYKPPGLVSSGQELVQMQKIWKREKTSGHSVNAVFLGDIGRSMNTRQRIQMVSDALVIGSEFIQPDSRIGLIIFDHQVTRVLPIAKFEGGHKDDFIRMARRLTAEGGTAMYDGIAVALSDLLDQQDPESKTVLIVLTDGDSQADSLSQLEVKKIASEIGIPIYILGMEPKESLMSDLSTVARSTGGEAFSVTPKDVRSRIANLLNSQL